MIVSVCPACRKKLMERYDLIETPYGEEFTGVCQFCIPQRETTLRQYEARQKGWKRQNSSIGDRRNNDRRAHYRPPFREGLEEAGG